MYKSFTKKQKLFYENCFQTKYIEHYCDDELSVYQYNKDRTFNEMRRDIYYDIRQNEFSNKYELLKWYSNTRNNLKDKNRKLHYTFLNNKFGPDGEYIQNQNELLEPIMRQIFTAVSEVAKKQGFDYVFDRSGDIYLVYARSEWNLNDAILIELGIDIDE